MPSRFHPRLRRFTGLFLLGVFSCFSAVSRAATQAYTLTITAPTQSASLPTGSPVTISVTVTGNANPIAKVDFYNLSTGKLLGTAAAAPFTLAWTPTATGNTFLRVTGTDSAGVTANSAIRTVIVVTGAATPPPPATPPTTTATASSLTAGTDTLPSPTGGVAYSQSLNATGGQPPYSWTVAAGSLPNGLTLSSSGVISGTPASADWIFAYPFSAYLKVTDSAGATATRTLTLNVLAPAGWVSGPASTPSTSPTTTYTVSVTNGAVGSSATSFAAGTTVSTTAGTPPAGQIFKQWSGNAPLADSLAPVTTFTMPAANVTLTAIFITPPPLPAIAAGHPRLWLRPADVATYRTWATPGNAVYQTLRQLLTRANYGYQICFPNGQAAVPYPDIGDANGWSGATITVSNDLVSEQHALTLAFFALIDPDPAARLVHAQKARALFMYVMNEAAKGHAPGQPFRDPLFAIYCRSNGTGEAWPLIVDWLQGVTDAAGQPVPILTAADKATIRSVFMTWAVDCLNAYTCGGDHPAPIGATNSTVLLPQGNAHRVAANNYYLNHARLITLMPLALDAADDAPLNAALPASAPGNTLRSYLLNATGAWLYQQYAMFGDPAAVRADYNLPATASVGLASGGVPAEGSLYGHSINYLQGQLLALQTAGLNDPAVLGPQAKLIDAPVWDRFVKAAFSSTVPVAKIFPAESYLGAVYQFAGFGDMLRSWVTPDMIEAPALLALKERAQGRTTHLAEARWYAINLLEGGAANFVNRIANPYSTTESLLYFMLFDPTDPTALTPADPRPGYATGFFDPGMGRVVARTAWSPAASFFSFRSGWLTINHQNSDAGQLELFRKGEWLTKELSNYDNNGNGQSSMWHNTLALQNWCSAGTPHLNWFEQNYWAQGSQWNNGLSAGDPTTTASFGAGYAFAHTDMTKLYNRPTLFTPADNATDFQHVSRSVLWLGDLAIVYDRATSLHSGFKRFNLNFAAPPVLDQVARTARTLTAGGQKFFVKTLQPVTAVLSYVPEAGSLTNIAGLESMTGRLVVEDPARPADVRFLHVLEGTDAAVPLPTAVVQSSAGSAYTGAIVGTSVALFPVNLTSSPAGTSYSVPASVAKHYVTGLTPGTGYTVTADSDGTTAQIVITTGGSATTDAAGVLAFDLANVLP